MYPTILHIYGPFAINSYGFCIAAGLVLFLWLVTRDPRRKALLNADQLSNVLMLGIVAGIFGSRLLYYLTEQHAIGGLLDFLAVWQGGLSLLGAVIATLVVVPIYLNWQRIAVLPFFDLVATYAPLLQSVSRIGCFLAGCCYGIHTKMPWAIMYSDPRSLAPICIPLHPTQLYSALSMFGIFLIMKLYAQQRYKQPGQQLSLYLILASASRLLIDFWRADRTLSPILGTWLSVNQVIAVALMAVGLVGLLYTSKR